MRPFFADLKLPVDKNVKARLFFINEDDHKLSTKTRQVSLK